MKVSKKQLKKIIREERTRLLRESMTDMTEVQDVIEQASRAVGDIFLRKMIALFDEGLDYPSDVTRDKDLWEDMVNDAVLEVDSGINDAITKVLYDIEGRLINGEY